jgi:predicted ATPase
VNDVVLRPLSVAHIGQLIADTVRCRPEDAAELARLVHAKTAGNPFFAIQFITELERRGLIALDRGAGRWRWDVAAIAAEGFTDNVVDLMVHRLRLLPRATQEALSLCACLGNVVDAATLRTISERTEAETDAALRPALAEELLLRFGGGFRFPHDRVQEAAYSLIPEGERAAAHLRVGRLLLSQTPSEELEEKVFAIVNQLDRAAELISSQTERDRVSELNLLAGNRAKGAGAHASGAQYFSAGTALLDADSWERRHDLRFALELGRAECDYLDGHRDEAERTLCILARRAKDSVEAAAAASVRIILHVTESRPDKAVDAGLEFLRRVGIEVPVHPSREQVEEEYARMLHDLGGRRIEELIDLPLMTDPVWRGAMEVLQTLDTPALFTDRNLYCLVCLHMTQLSLRYGNTDASCYGYVIIGAVIGSVFGDYPRGIQFGRLGYELMDRRKLDRYRAPVCDAFACLISIWSEHVRTLVDLQARAFGAALEAGDLNHACYAFGTRIASF